MSDVTLAVVNDATQQTVVFVGTPATLGVTLGNGTGSPIVFASDTAASTLTIFMPDFYDDAALTAMNVELAEWSYAYQSALGALVLTFTGADGTVWAPGTNLAFAITGASTSAAPASDQSVQVNPAGMQGSVATQLTAPLVLSNPPKPGNASLLDVLQLSLDDQGSVYVSQPNDPLQNTLFLNLKNIGNAPIYAGTNMWTGSPVVKVSFVYGLTSGALAPAVAPPPGSAPAVGSAWSIAGGIANAPASDPWTGTKPDTTAVVPVWQFAPTNTNPDVIGIGDDANITLSFSSIVSFTGAGHTQMIVDFKGFMKDDTTAYDEAVYVLDIVKQQPPPTRGLLALYSRDPVVTVRDATLPVTVALNWTMMDVAKVQLITAFPAVALKTVSYPNFAPLAYDAAPVTLPPAAQSTAVGFTLQSFDGNGGYLNSLQFTVFLDSLVFVDPRDEKSYPLLLLNDTYWLAANLDYDAPGSQVYGTESTFGRLYPNANANAAQIVPPGWRIPSADDWNELFAAFTYAQLVAGGSSTFAAQLGGWFDGTSDSEQGVRGFYWTSSPGTPGTIVCAEFSSASSTASTASSVPAAYALSLRLIRDV